MRCNPALRLLLLLFWLEQNLGQYLNIKLSLKELLLRVVHVEDVNLNIPNLSRAICLNLSPFVLLLLQPTTTHWRSSVPQLKLPGELRDRKETKIK